MKSVKSHTFNGKTYTVVEVSEIMGLCDMTGQELTILRGDNANALGSALEESLHAIGIPDRYLHKPDNKVKTGESSSKIDDVARFLWRLGYRRVK